MFFSCSMLENEECEIAEISARKSWSVHCQHLAPTMFTLEPHHLTSTPDFVCPTPETDFHCKTHLSIGPVQLARNADLSIIVRGAPAHLWQT